MSTILQAKRIKDALKKAQRVGRIEEEVTIRGCSLVIENHGPEEYAAIAKEIDGLEGNELQSAFYLGHLSRAIVEVNGTDLRGAKYIEDEVEGVDGSVKSVRMERHEWLRENLLKEWGSEAILVGFQKVLELVSKAGELSREGVKFKFLNESNEEKIRRLLVEVNEAAAELPDDLMDNVLKEFGYVRGSTPEELELVKERAKDFAREQAAKAEEEEPETGTEEAPVVAAEELMKRRVPLNQAVETAAVLGPPKAPIAIPNPSEISPQLKDKAAKIAELEGLDPEMVALDSLHKGPVELARRLEPVDAAQVKIDRPPVVTVNPRFQRRR
jgi:hypothetical protein